MTDEIKEKIAAQAKYCKDKSPISFAPGEGFAPTSGICWSCHKQIYTAITLERASTSLITGCPHCNRSYCD